MDENITYTPEQWVAHYQGQYLDTLTVDAASQIIKNDMTNIARSCVSIGFHLKEVQKDAGKNKSKETHMRLTTTNGTYCTAGVCKHRSSCKIKQNCLEEKIYDRLRKYENAEEEGMLFRFPFRIGDSLYDIDHNKIEVYEVMGFRYGRILGEDEDEYLEYYAEPDGKPRINVECITSYGSCSMPISNFGNTFFLTREEAQAKLEEIRGEKE
ncbi:MAG: hypothetical protein KH452_06030 [Clostridiales bacterium]|nr:hypothetical protein [Clostridiales bacterium]